MDKWQRRDEGYRTDWADGVYLVSHIIFDDEQTALKESRTVYIKNGMVTHPNWKYRFTQLDFFEVNKVIKEL